MRSPWRRMSSPSPADGRRPRAPSATAAMNASRSPAGRLSTVLESVEQVALEQLRVEARERLRARDVVEAEPLAERRAARRTGRAGAGTRRAARRGRARERLKTSACAPVGECDAEPVAPSRRAPARPRPARRRARAGPPRAARPCAGGAPGTRRAARHRREAPRAPAALLDARDRNPRLALRGDEHGHVEDPVLLRAEQLLAVVEEHIRVERVRDRELGHRPGRVHLGHAEPERQRLLERHVLGARLQPREERRHDDAAMLDRLGS